MYIKNIAQLCYELYKIDWMSRIPISTISETIKEYYVEKLSIDNNEYSFEDYINEIGFPDGIYASFEEFSRNEFLDEEYMKKLLNNKELIDEYDRTVA